MFFLYFSFSLLPLLVSLDIPTSSPLLLHEVFVHTHKLFPESSPGCTISALSAFLCVKAASVPSSSLWPYAGLTPISSCLSSIGKPDPVSTHCVLPFYVFVGTYFCIHAILLQHPLFNFLYGISLGLENIIFEKSLTPSCEK